MAPLLHGNREQADHYQRLIAERRPTRGLFSCGYAERFDPFMLDSKPFLTPVYERLFDRLFPEPAGDLLDAGCGTGLYWPVLRRHCRRLVGTDFSAAMVAEAQRLVAAKGLTQAEARVANAEDLAELPDAGFDTVLCVDILHHIPQLDRAIASFHRVLKPGGRLCIIEPNTINPLIFLAHLIPAEERRAILRDYAPLLRRRFAPYFTDIAVHYVNFVTSAASEAQLRKVERIGRLLEAVPWLRPLSLRQLLTMRKPPAA